MRSEEDDKKDHIQWANDQNSNLAAKSKRYAGKTVRDIRYYGNGEEMITFTDGTRLLYHVENYQDGDDLYSKTEADFNFDTWEYRE